MTPLSQKCASRGNEGSKSVTCPSMCPVALFTAARLCPRMHGCRRETCRKPGNSIWQLKKWGNLAFTAKRMGLEVMSNEISQTQSQTQHVLSG